MIAATVKCLASGTGLTLNKEYGALSLNVDGGNVKAVIVDDNGNAAGVNVDGSSFDLVEAFTGEKVI